MSDLIQKRAKRRRTLTRGLILVVVLLIGAFVYSRMNNQEPAPSYRTAEVTRGDIESSIVALGTLEPLNFVDVGAQVSGILLSLNFEVGDEVQAGELVAEIDPMLAQSRVDADRAQLRELEASKLQQLAQLQLAEAKAARNRALLGADAISAAEAEATEADLAVAEARIAQLDAQIARTQSTLEGDLTSLGYTKIYAPMTGTVISHSAVEGQTLNANQTAPVIMRIADLSIMTVKADISEADVPRLRPGMPVYFSTLGNPDREWRTTVRQLLPEPEVVNDVVLYKALLDVENSDRALLPSMTAQVSFVLGESADVMKIPAAALQIPPAMLIAAGGEPNEAVTIGRGEGAEGAGMPAGVPDEMRERFANMSEAERAQMRQRFEAQGGPGGPGGPGGGNFQRGPGGPGGPGGGNFQGGSADEEEDVPVEGQPDYVTDFGAPPRQQTVLVLVDGTPQARDITVGLVSRTEAEVISGLQPGETVILGELGESAGAAAGGNGGNFRGPPGGMILRGG